MKWLLYDSIKCKALLRKKAEGRFRITLVKATRLLLLMTSYICP
jgi:hypothetical protein